MSRRNGEPYLRFFFFPPCSTHGIEGTVPEMVGYASCKLRISNHVALAPETRGILSIPDFTASFTKGVPTGKTYSGAVIVNDGEGAMNLKGWQLSVAAGCLFTFFLVLCGLGAAGVMVYILTDEENARLPLREMGHEESEQRTNLEELYVSPARAVNRIAVLGSVSNIFTIAPDGTDKQSITNDADDALTYRYPTWSPDSARLAYVELEQSADSQTFTSALHIAPARGGTPQRIETESAPFYLYWSPTSEQIAFLSNWGDSMALRTLTVGESREPQTIHTGMPFFFSWEPSGDSLFAHIGSDTLSFLDEDGNETKSLPRAGLFQAPHWSRDGDRIAYVREGEATGASVLAMSDANGENETSLWEADGLFSFNWSPDNRRIAYSFTEAIVGLPAFGALYVEDVDTGERVTVSEEEVISFFWSPDGTKLAYLVPEEHSVIERAPEAAPLRQEGEFWVRWYVWDGTNSTRLTIFSPTQDFLFDYIRYFDQYAQSVSLWSPDSQTLLYAGLSESGLSGIWTLPVAPGSTAKRISPGVLAAWSPQ